MLKRPEAFGTEIKITSLEDADAALHELAWIQSRLATIDADTKAKIHALTLEAQEKAIVTIDDQSWALPERATAIATVLAKWTEKHIEKHLDGKKRSIDLPHGKLGLRQQPLVAQISETENAKSVLDKIDEATGLVTAVNSILERKTAVGTAKGRDLIDIKVTPATKAMKDGLESKRLTPAQLEGLGIVLRDAYDEPVVTPSKIVVTG